MEGKICLISDKGTCSGPAELEDLSGQKRTEMFAAGGRFGLGEMREPMANKPE